MAKAFSVFVEIGGRVGSSLGGAIATAEGKLAGLSRSFRTQALAGKAAIGEMKSAMKSMGAFAAAGGISVGIKHALGAGAEFAHEIQALRNAGRTYEEVAEGIAAANKTILAVPTTTLSENVKVLNETVGAFGDFHHAAENLDFNTKLGSVLHNAVGDKMGDMGHVLKNLVRTMEIRGSANDPHRYQKEVAELSKAMIFTGGDLSTDKLLLFAQQANPAIKNYSERFLTKIAPSLIQELGGDRAGTAATAWTNTIMGKTKDKRATEAWMGLGLLDKKQVLKSKQGNYVGWQPGAIKGTDDALRDPLAWTENTLIPALRKKGINTDDQLETTKALQKLFRNSNANRFAQSITQVNDRNRLHKDENMINKVGNIGDIYDETLVNDPKMALTALKGSFENLFSSATVGLMKPASEAMISVARGINALASALVKHPELAKVIGAVAIALGAYSSLRLMSWALGLGGMGQAIGGLALSATTGLAARLLGVARGVLALSAASAAGAAGKLRGLVAGVAMLGSVGGRRAVFGALTTSIMGFGRGILGVLNPMNILRAMLFALGAVFSPVGLAVAAVVAALVVLGIWVKNNFSGLVQFFTSFGAAFTSALGPTAGGMIQKVVEWLKEAWDWLNKLLGPIDESGEKWKSWGENAGKAAGDIVNFVAELPGKISAKATEIKTAFTDLAQKGWDGLKSFNWLGLGQEVVQAIIDGIASMGSALAGKLGQMASDAAAKFKGMFSFGGGATPAASAGGAAGGIAGTRASGGPIVAGRPYLVGEKGPELVTPSRNGFVHTAAATSKMLNRFSEIGGSADGGSGQLRVPAAGDIAHATGGDRNVSVSRGDTSFSISINAPSGDAQDISTKVRAEVMRVIGQMESEQRGMLND